MTRFRRSLLLVCGVAVLAACTSTATSSGPPATAPASGASTGTAARGTVPSADPAMAEAIRAHLRQRRHELDLRAVIVKVSVDGKEILTWADGESMTGVPATTDMHFRNGAVAISYVATLLLLLDEQGVMHLDDKLSTYLPDFPHSNEVTLRQLARMTSGYHDYVLDSPAMQATFLQDPYRQWTPEELLAAIKDEPLWYTPGTNWNYAHTNYLLLGLAIEKGTGKRVDQLLQEKVLGPMGLTSTVDPGTPAIPEPALHAFTGERRELFNIPDSTRFYEESTYWNPSWTITRGAIETTTIDDLHATAIGIGSGTLLKPASYQLMTSTDLRGKTTSVPGCGTCHPQSEPYSYGMGLVTTGDWVVQNPLFSGEAGAMAYLPKGKVAIAIVVTYDEDAFTKPDGYANQADRLWREIGAMVAPDDPPPQKP